MKCVLGIVNALVWVGDKHFSWHYLTLMNKWGLYTIMLATGVCIKSRIWFFLQEIETLRTQLQTQSMEIAKLQSEKQELLQKLVIFQDFSFLLLPFQWTVMTSTSCLFFFNCPAIRQSLFSREYNYVRPLLHCLTFPYCVSHTKHIFRRLKECLAQVSVLFGFLHFAEHHSGAHIVCHLAQTELG